MAKNFDMARGDTRLLVIEVLDANKVNMDISVAGWDIKVYLKYNEEDADGSAKVIKTLVSGIIIQTIGGKKKAVCKISPADTSDLVKEQTLFWKAKATDPDGNPYTVEHGNLLVYIV